MIPHLARTANILQSIAITALPHGGQRSARQNAWASMSSDAVRARARRDADLAMSRAIAMSAMSQHPAAAAR